MPSLSELLDDLEDEFADVRSLVAALGADDSGWDLATPADGWVVRDQVSHLAFFDDAGRTAMVDPELFAEDAERAMNRTGDPMQEHLSRGRAMDGEDLVAWWDSAHHGMVAALADAEPSARVPWYGPAMGVRSFVSARLMETWAHGHDIADTLGLPREPTGRLRHIAHLGVGSRPFSYLIRDRPVPPECIEVTLVAPSGDRWTWEVGASDPGEPAATIAG